MRILILAATMAFAFGSMANAKPCKDPATGKFIKCPVAAAAPAATAAKKPVCKKGVACGNSCIAVGKVCHKPT